MNMNNRVGSLVYYYEVENFHATLFKYTRAQHKQRANNNSQQDWLYIDLTTRQHCTMPYLLYHARSLPS